MSFTNSSRLILFVIARFMRAIQFPCGKNGLPEQAGQ
jgi:hypothetical protein